MAVKLNGAGQRHASSLIAGGNVDKSSSWSFSAEDGNKLLGPDGNDWGNYGKHFLGEDPAESEKTKARWKYPVAKSGKVFRSGVIAAKQRAAQQGATSIADAAGRLLEKIDGKEEKKESAVQHSWFKMQAPANDDAPAEIMIYDEIGNFGIGAADFDKQLKALGDVKNILLRINSPGGDVFSGLAIYNTLDAHPAEITAKIDGIAASAASLIAMAADKIMAPDNAFLLIHEPYALTIGPAEAHLAMAADLERMSASFAGVYAKRSGQELETVRALMKADRLMDATEASSLGYVDELLGKARIAASFDLARVPEKFRESIAAAMTSDVELESPETEPEPEVKAMPSPSTPLPENPAPSPEPAYDAVAALDLCTLAGMPDLARDFIAKREPVEKVRAQLLALKARDADGLVIDPVPDQPPGGNEAGLAEWRRLQGIVKKEMGIGARSRS